MPYRHLVEVRPEDIDELGHAGNLVYLRWVLEAALAHSTAVGLDQAAYLARREVWVVRSHEIQYVRPALVGERLAVDTRVASMSRIKRSRMVFSRRGWSAPSHQPSACIAAAAATSFVCSAE